MLNDIKRGVTANTIALHDFKSERPDIKAWFEYAVEFFKLHNIKPTRIGITGEDYPSSQSTVLFKNGEKRLYKNDFKNIESVSIEAWDNNENTICLIWISLRSQKTTLVLYIDNQIMQFEKNIMNKLAKDLAGFVDSKYGYCYQRDFNHGPDWYAFGTIQGIEDGDPEENLIMKWSHKYRLNNKYNTGDLRDIYPMNILCGKHLDRIVHNQRFQDWILSDARRGSLEKLNDDLYAWWLETDQISYVREALRDTGMILCI